MSDSDATVVDSDADPVAPDADPGAIDRGARDHRISWVVFVGAALTIFGTFSTWASGSGVTLNGVEGPHNGWIAVLAALVAAGVARPLARGSGPAIVATGLAATRVLRIVVGTSGAPDLGRAWGWWVSLIGGLVLIGAFGWALVYRVTSHARGELTATPRRVWHRVGAVLAVIGLLAMFLGFSLMSRVLVVAEDPSWPPPPDAVTSDEAQAATEAFVAGDRRPSDVDIDYAWSTAASIDPWPEGSEFFPRIFADVEAAQDSVHILMFGFNSQQVGSEMVDLLIAKLDQGVEVRVLVDSYGSRAFGDHEVVFRTLTEAGAEVVINDVVPVDRDGLYPDRSFDWRQDEVGRAEHRKLFVIDGVVAWNGGAGIEDHFLDGRFHDVMVQVTGNIVRQSQAVFLTAFASHGASLPSDLSRYFPDQPDPGTIPIALLQVVPGGFSSGPQAVREMIDNAEQRLDIMNPYLTDVDMIKRITNAAERGVRVRVVVSAESNNGFATAVAKHHYGRMLEAGVEVWEYPDAVVHAKLVVADDMVQFGTLNFDAWALYRDFELSMLVESAELAALFEERIFGPDIARSVPAEPLSGVRDTTIAWIADKLGYFI
jgi:cardiolipin synthase